MVVYIAEVNRRQRMSKLNPDFWEVTLSHEGCSRFSTKDRLGYEDPEDLAARHERAESAKALLPELQAIIDEVLTERQRQVVNLHFFEQLNQRQIAETLGIAQQSVRERLYGKVRRGRVVGGALRKLRKACAARGVRWE